MQVFSKSRRRSKENVNNSEEGLVWFSTLPHLSNFHTVPKIAREVRKEEKVGDRETQRERKCREEREMASQTDCLAAPGSPALSVI